MYLGNRRIPQPVWEGKKLYLQYADVIVCVVWDKHWAAGHQGDRFLVRVIRNGNELFSPRPPAYREMDVWRQVGEDEQRMEFIFMLRVADMGLSVKQKLHSTFMV